MATDFIAPEARSRGLSYQQLLDTDSKPVPDVLRWQHAIETGPVRVPISRYTSPAFHQLEVEKLWKRAWQMACHEDDIPEVGDYLPYDIADLSDRR